MSQFHRVSVVWEANGYCGGRVASRTVLFGGGSRKTLGIRQAGEYELSADERERMASLSGELDAPLPNTGLKHIGGGQSIEVPAVSTFRLKVARVTDDCCSYPGEE